MYCRMSTRKHCVRSITQQTHDATTASIFAYWPLRQLRSLRALRTLRCVENRTLVASLVDRRRMNFARDNLLKCVEKLYLHSTDDFHQTFAQC